MLDNVGFRKWSRKAEIFSVGPFIALYTVRHTCMHTQRHLSEYEKKIAKANFSGIKSQE